MKSHYRVHKETPPVPIPSQANAVHPLISYVYKDHLNIIIQPTPASS